MLNINTFNLEIYRKLIHFIYTSTIALSLLYFGRDIVLPWFIFIAVFLTLLDLARCHSYFLRRIFIYFFSSVIRPIEYRVITGASWVVISAALTTLLFNQNAAIVGLLVLSLSDSMAALVGIKFGKTMLFSKSLEGTIAFFISASIIILLLSQASLIINIIALFLATIGELFSNQKINDNLSIPIVTAFALSIPIFI